MTKTNPKAIYELSKDSSQKVLSLNTINQTKLKGKKSNNIFNNYNKIIKRILNSNSSSFKKTVFF